MSISSALDECFTNWTSWLSMWHNKNIRLSYLTFRTTTTTLLAKKYNSTLHIINWVGFWQQQHKKTIKLYPNKIYVFHIRSLRNIYTYVSGNINIYIFLPIQPPVGQSLLIHDVSISHTTTHHNR